MLHSTSNLHRFTLCKLSHKTLWFIVYNSSPSLQHLRMVFYITCSSPSHYLCQVYISWCSCYSIVLSIMLFTLSLHHIVALSCQCIALCLYRFFLSLFVLCVFPSQFPPHLGFHFTMLFVISHFFSICFLVL